MDIIAGLVGFVAGLAAIISFLAAFFKPAWARPALRITALMSFLIGLIYLLIVKTDVGSLCSIIIMQISAVILALLHKDE